MSPQTARESPVFLFYTSLAFALLLLGGVAIAVLRWGLHKHVDHAWRAYCGWLLLVPGTFGCIYLGRVTTIVLVTVVAIAGFREFVRATGLYRDWMMTGAAYLGILATGAVSIVRDPTDDKPGCAAYVCGKLFGRHKLRTNISPKKSWEGALGALAFSILLPWVVHFTLPHFRTAECFLAGLIIGIGGQVGDLALSVIKRDVGIKDMGATIPGHGGFLDRTDSLVYVAPLFLHMTRYFHGLY